MRAIAALFCVFCLCAAGFAQEKAPPKPKPEIKRVSLLGVVRGKPVSLVVYGENLSPQSATLIPPDGVKTPPLPVTLSAVEPTTTDEDKKRSAQQIRAQFTIPADAAFGVYTLTLAHDEKVNATAPFAVWESAAVEAEIKQVGNTFQDATPLDGASVAVTGALSRGDRADVYRFQAQAGETWEITCLAGSAGSAIDAVVRLRDFKYLPVALAAGDERQDRRITFQAARSGTYYIEVSDAEGRGGEAFRYRLSLRKVVPEATPQSRQAR